MKKLLIAGLFATVAIGGAYAQSEYRNTGSTVFFNCNGDVDPTCSTAAPALPWIRISDGSLVSSPPADYDQTYTKVNP